MKTLLLLKEQSLKMSVRFNVSQCHFVVILRNHKITELITLQGSTGWVSHAHVTITAVHVPLVLGQQLEVLSLESS